jgi:hypothetical protein
MKPETNETHGHRFPEIRAPASKHVPAVADVVALVKLQTARQMALGGLASALSMAAGVTEPLSNWRNPGGVFGPPIA